MLLLWRWRTDLHRQFLPHSKLKEFPVTSHFLPSRKDSWKWCVVQLRVVQTVSEDCRTPTLQGALECNLQLMANFVHFLELRPWVYLRSLSAVCEFRWTEKVVAWGCEKRPVTSLFAEFDVATTLVISTTQSVGLGHGMSSLASRERRLLWSLWSDGPLIFNYVVKSQPGKLPLNWGTTVSSTGRQGMTQCSLMQD